VNVALIACPHLPQSRPRVFGELVSFARVLGVNSSSSPNWYVSAQLYIRAKRFGRPDLVTRFSRSFVCHKLISLCNQLLSLSRRLVVFAVFILCHHHLSWEGSEVKRKKLLSTAKDKGSVKVDNSYCLIQICGTNVDNSQAGEVLRFPPSAKVDPGYCLRAGVWSYIRR
jgi:hypothetical protein